jgi:hypothetical protein
MDPLTISCCGIGFVSLNVLKIMIFCVAWKNINIFLKQNVYMDVIFFEWLLLLLEYKATFVKLDGHQAEFIWSIKFGKVIN